MLVPNLSPVSYFCLEELQRVFTGKNFIFLLKLRCILCRRLKDRHPLVLLKKDLPNERNSRNATKEAISR